MENDLNLQTNTGTGDEEDDAIVAEPFLDIPDELAEPAGYYYTPYSVGLRNLEHINDIKTYRGKFEYLSEPVQKIMFDESTSDFIEGNLGSAFALDVGQKITVTETIRDVLLGDIFIGDMVKEIQAKLAVDEIKAKDISSMIAAELFPPALESIKRVQRLKFPFKIQELAKAKPVASPSPEPIKPVMPPPPQPTPQQTRPVMPPAEPPKPTPPPVSSFKLPIPEEIKQMPLTQPMARQDSPQTARPVERAPLPTLPQPPPDIRTPQIPRFEIPDLGATLPPKAPPAVRPDSLQAGPSSSQEKAKQSLEEELEKVAGVIDLRAKLKE